MPFRMLAVICLIWGTLSSVQAGFWRCTLPGGSYTVDMTKVASVSTSEYLVNGVGRVTEFTVDTIGSDVARFYYIEPNLPSAPGGVGQSAVDELKAKAEEAMTVSGNEPPWKKVIKIYPTTTHAHTIEYRLDSLEQVDTLFKSLDGALKTQADTQIKIAPPS